MSDEKDKDIPLKKTEDKSFNATRDKVLEVEGTLFGFRDWEHGNGADIFLYDDSTEYFTRRKLNTSMKQTGRFKIRQGEGGMSKKWEIIDDAPLKKNMSISMPPDKQPIPQGKERLIQMTEMSFKSLMENKQHINTANIVSLQEAMKLYCHHIAKGSEPDLTRGAEEVIKIAKALEYYLRIT